ncbi:SDR family NAD(P)-dependent oxidoreductase [Symbioplanes lichenis]|uniref:SDR family NAD(P)-dependent oxidoreductase n=1 Tax=Symbioplanes lichenis TaxID=1629072 RepID=UPI002738DD17|nr:SDR family NAD(P)-dependent oxidoreductase [Actinoplanes lichenis]
MPTALIVGASRTIGLGLTAELLRRGWDAVGTVRGPRRTALHDLAGRSDGRLTVEELEMTDAASRAALHRRLTGRTLDLLLVSAAITNGDQPIGDVDEQTFTRVMTTNAYAPMRVVETLLPLVSPAGTVGVLSSSQGSLTLNTNGGHEVYRASKSALNQLMRSFAARHAGDPRPLLLINPGWVRTDLGGPGAVLTVDQSATGVIDTVLAQHGKPGLQFLDHRGQTVPW